MKHCLAWKWHLCELGYIHCNTIDIGQWTFTKIWLMWPQLYIEWRTWGTTVSKRPGVWHFWLKKMKFEWGYIFVQPTAWCRVFSSIIFCIYVLMNLLIPLSFNVFCYLYPNCNLCIFFFLCPPLDRQIEICSTLAQTLITSSFSD